MPCCAARQQTPKPGTVVHLLAMTIPRIKIVDSGIDETLPERSGGHRARRTFSDQARDQGGDGRFKRSAQNNRMRANFFSDGASDAMNRVDDPRTERVNARVDSCGR